MAFNAPVDVLALAIQQQTKLQGLRNLLGQNGEWFGHELARLV